MFNVLTNKRMFLKRDKPYINLKILHLDGRNKQIRGRLIPPQLISTGVSMFPKLFGSARRRGKKKNQILKSTKIVDTGIAQTAQIN